MVVAVKWLDIHQRVKNMIRSVFEAAAVTHPEMQCSKSRAIYGMDVMLDNSFQPKLLEVCDFEQYIYLSIPASLALIKIKLEYNLNF